MSDRPRALKSFHRHELEEANQDYAGFCLACGSRQDTVEPDARHYRCDDCGAKWVYGAEEIILMGLVTGEVDG
jgi:DNA-directed RNA polymerase subunit RPC12/RpoP